MRMTIRKYNIQLYTVYSCMHNKRPIREYYMYVFHWYSNITYSNITIRIDCILWRMKNIWCRYNGWQIHEDLS